MAGQRKTFNEINITPLTDIFLVLLIIMMVIAPLLDQQGLNLAVPNMIEVQDEIKDSKLIKIIVTNDNRYLLNDSEIPVSEIGSIIKEQAAENPDGLLIMTQDDATQNFPDGMMIETDGEATHGAVVKLMDEARNNGVTNISITEY